MTWFGAMAVDATWGAAYPDVSGDQEKGRGHFGRGSEGRIFSLLVTRISPLFFMAALVRSTMACFRCASRRRRSNPFRGRFGGASQGAGWLC